METTAEKTGPTGLMAIAKRAVAVLKEYDYDNLEDVIDAEVVINEYTERYGL